MRKIITLTLALLALLMPGMARAAEGHEAMVDLLARLIWAEAEDQSDVGQQAVGCVALNRLHNGRWGDTLEGVITAPRQFALERFNRARPTEKEYANARAALEADTRDDGLLPRWIMFFREGRHHRWDGYTESAVIGDHYFGGFEVDK